MRLSAAERRESVVLAAVAEFARGGFHGTSTEAIARRVGVSQPYLFRLFPTKHALFEAAAERSFRRMAEAFAHAAEGLSGAEALTAMADARARLLHDPDIPLMQLQAIAAAASTDRPAFTERVRRDWLDLWDLVRARTGATPEELTAFFACGVLTDTRVALGVAPP
ncbi:TetR/AcrR family transcriptional regulator [Streptomyces himalayensis]|uniref:TetR/AcrR family transcriptional regulator n=1 Tax=Streptomyces himalayensis TaxID=2820085 RepID=UPI00215DA49F|nr:TetR/AcrR family transcriptional regulator [Streptomyces himalayensis]